MGFSCGGAIDGSHIPIIAPHEFHTDYFNREGFHSIIIQAMVDHLYRFTDIYVGWPGKAHDACVFANSALYHKGQSGALFCHAPRKRIQGIDMPVVVLGDAAYPLLPWLPGWLQSALLSSLILQQKKAWGPENNGGSGFTSQQVLIPYRVMPNSC